MLWTKFVQILEKEVNWEEPTIEQGQIIEEILREMSRSPEQLQIRCEQIINDKETFRTYKPHMNYPRITMDKFMLYMDPFDRFRVRMHRFKCKKLNGEKNPKVHSHKWLFSTIILKGSYKEVLYDIEATDPEKNTAILQFRKEHVLRVGDTNTGTLDIAHQTINESEDEHCISLFVRGKTFDEGAKIFDLEKGTFYYTFDPDQQLIVGLEHMGRLDPDFH